MFATSSSRQQCVRRLVAGRNLIFKAVRNKIPGLECLGTSTTFASVITTQPQYQHHAVQGSSSFHMDEEYYHRHVMGNRYFTSSFDDEYDHIMRRSGTHHNMSTVSEGEGPDVDDYDHRSLYNPKRSNQSSSDDNTASTSTSHQPHSITTADQVDYDDFDHRSFQVDPFFAEQVLAAEQREESTPEEDIHRAALQRSSQSTTREPQQDATSNNNAPVEVDIDDFDHRSLQNPPRAASQMRKDEFSVENDDFDVDDYDHRSLQNAPSQTKPLKFGIRDTNGRSKWALGNVTSKDVQAEKESQAQTKAEKMALERKQAEIRHHAWE